MTKTKEDPIKSQKVYVTLESVLALQAEYRRALDELGKVKQSESFMLTRRMAVVDGFERVLRILGLPINIEGRTNR